jgi:uncharacterized protein YqeY
MSLESKIVEDLKAAMKAKDKKRLRGIRAIKAAIMLEKTKGSDHTISGDDEIKILQKLVKQRRDSLAIYEKEGRDDLAQTEKEEIEIITQYLPEQLSPEELEAKIKAIIEQVGATSMRDMGKVMGMATKAFAGKADGKSISAKVKELLSS